MTKSYELPEALRYLEALPRETESLVATPDGSAAPIVDEAPGLWTNEEQHWIFVTTTVLLVGLDKMREHRGQDDKLGKGYAGAIEALGFLADRRAAPSMLLELAIGVPESASDPDWRKGVAEMVGKHDKTWPYVSKLDELPIELTADELEAIADLERCELLDALTTLEVLAAELRQRGELSPAGTKLTQK